MYVQGQGPSEHLGKPLFEVRVLHFPARVKLSEAPQSVHRVASPVEEVEEKDSLKKQVSDHTVGWTGQRQICWAQTEPRLAPPLWDEVPLEQVPSLSTERATVEQKHGETLLQNIFEVFGLFLFPLGMPKMSFPDANNKEKIN